MVATRLKYALRNRSKIFDNPVIMWFVFYAKSIGGFTPKALLKS